MKTNWKNHQNANCRASAALLFIILLSIMMVLVTAEARSLIQLRREIKLLEQHQLKRLNSTPAANLIAPQSQPK